MLRRVIASAVLACALIPFVGCTQPDGELNGGLTVNPQTGVTNVQVGGKLTWHHAPLQKLAMWMAPLSGNDLASLDPSQAIFNYTLSNAQIVSTNGTVTISVTDATTGVIVGQQDFGYVVNGNGLFAQDPNAVSNWLQQFTAYSSLDVTVAATTYMEAIITGPSSATINAVYQGVTYASATGSWSGHPPIEGGGGCRTRICPNQ